MGMKDEDLHKITTAVHTGVEVAVATNMERYRRETASDRGVRLRGARALPFALGSGAATVSGQVFTGEPCKWMGFIVAETSGAASATLMFYDGPDANIGSTLVGTVTLAPNESARDYWGPYGVGLSTGLYVAVTGQISGAVLTIPGA